MITIIICESSGNEGIVRLRAGEMGPFGEPPAGFALAL